MGGDTRWDRNYEDFETGKYRESDIFAHKTINGFRIRLIVQCKKTDDTQLILYSPYIYGKKLLVSTHLKVFPVPQPYGLLPYSYPIVMNTVANIKLFDRETPLSKGIIFSKGDKIVQDNAAFFSSLNGMLKKSIDYCIRVVDSDARSLFLYVVYEGLMFQLSNSEEEDFILKEINYGKYDFEYHFRFFDFDLHGKLFEAASKFGNNFAIEILKPSIFKSYILELEERVIAFKKEDLTGWGKDSPPLRKRRKKALARRK